RARKTRDQRGRGVDHTRASYPRAAMGRRPRRIDRGPETLPPALPRVFRSDELVKRVINEVEVSITRERHTLEQQWAEGSDVSTEDLRLCLQRYRGFLDRTSS